MSLQYKSLAIVVGAKGDEIQQVANELKKTDRANTTVATQILKQLRRNDELK